MVLSLIIYFGVNNNRTICISKIMALTIKYKPYVYQSNVQIERPFHTLLFTANRTPYTYRGAFLIFYQS